MKHLHTYESFLNESFKDTREIVGDEMETIIDALEFLGKGMGYEAVKKACKGKIPYTIFLKDKSGFPKPGGLHSSSIDFMADGSNPSMSVEDYIDCVNTVLDDHGYDKYKVKILK
jgi:hypothetical protein